MGKEKAALSFGSLIQELFQFGVYKGSQGKVTRQATFVLLACLLYTSPSPRDQRGSRMPSSA